MPGELLIAIVGVLGGLFGGLVSGVVQYIATMRHERHKYVTGARTDAYNAYINAVSRLSIYNGATGNKPYKDLNPVEQKEFLAIQMDYHNSKNRLALYGSPRVLQKLGIFSSQYARMVTDADIEAYIDVIEAMREDSHAHNYVGFRRDVDNLMLRGMLK